jgi:MoxR-like ATPase
LAFPGQQQTNWDQFTAQFNPVGALLPAQGPAAPIISQDFLLLLKMTHPLDPEYLLMTGFQSKRLNKGRQTLTQINAHEISLAINHVSSYLNSVILGKSEVIRHLVAALLAKGHVLIEDVPGVGKTTLAWSLARVLECQFQRISFTSDLMPSDILGVTIFDRNTSAFLFQKGPIFTNILLADELNRTTPKTQSAFLEAMESGQVTIEKNTYPLPDPFLVMATQNPLEFSGTFPLPISQLDRFLMRISMGYPSREYEERMLDQYRDQTVADIEVTPIPIGKVLTWQHQIPSVRMDPSLVKYIALLAAQTRQHSDIQLGVSPRATLGLQRSAQAQAVLSGRDYVIPEDIREMAPLVWSHRILLRNQIGIGSLGYKRAEERVQEILESTPVPL